MKNRQNTASPKGRGDTPTSIIQSSKKSPQLYGKDVVTLNLYTTIHRFTYTHIITHRLSLLVFNSI